MDVKSSLLPEKIDSPQKLLEALNSHDWDYPKSDDFREWRRGDNDWDKLCKAAHNIPNGEAILRHYRAIRTLIDYGHE